LPLRIEPLENQRRLRKQASFFSRLDPAAVLWLRYCLRPKTVNVTKLILPLCIWLMAALCASASSQQAPIRSFSGQFTAWHLQRPGSRPAMKLAPTRAAGGWAFVMSDKTAPPPGNQDEVPMDPSLLVVSCERLKAWLLNELGQPDRWQGRIDLIINPSLPKEDGPQLTASREPQGWTYQLQLPSSVQEEILLRKLFQTLLLEIANRQAGVQSAEIPLWLVEGMSAELQAKNLPVYILQPGQHWSGSVVWQDRSQTMPSELRRHAALTFQQLSWPEASDLTREGLPLYRSCAQLFLEQLLRFDDGKACLRSMIGQLPEHWNWQTAFLLGFHSHFEQLLDVEKWWGVSYVDFRRGYKVQPWSAADCRKELQSSLDVPVAVRFGTDGMPVDAKITLQEVIRQWPDPDALAALRRATGGLSFLVPRATAELRPLVELYLKTLLGYVRDSQEAEREQHLGKREPSRLSGIKADAIQQLDALDRQREGLWAGAVSTDRPQISAVGPAAAKSAAR
jgi:hypothetical protein